MKRTKGRFLRRSKGVTLVALVVTIVILIILASVSISLVFGENGIIQVAQTLKKQTEDIISKEETELNSLMEEYANIMATEPEIPEPIDPTKPLDSELVINPVIEEGMTPVKYNNITNKWVKTTNQDAEWYDYGTKQWANAVLKGAIFDSSGNLDESKTYSMVVWIPRYAYKITSNWHKGGNLSGDIDVKFIDTANKDRTGIIRNGIYNGSNGTYSDYVVHPAFNYGGEQIPGFWVGKFESSHTECTTDENTGEYDGTDKTMQIKAGITSWRNITVDNIYKVCTGFTAAQGLDPHMLKNTEWGAVAYLSKSKYGKQTEEIWINNNSNFITGQAGSSVSASSSTSTNAYNIGNGPKASTTGNVTGVYDMSGGAWEYVAGYVNNSYASSNGASVINAPAKHKDVYNVGASDSSAGNYSATASKYGDAVYETSNNGSNSNGSWYRDKSLAPHTSHLWFERGGSYLYTTETGVFAFTNGNGDGGGASAFRLVLVVPGGIMRLT